MHIPLKKLKNGFEIPEYGLGTWQMGGKYKPDSANDDVADVRAIQYAIAQGVTHIDTAEIYAAGHAEELVARAIKEGNIDREKLFIVSKVEGSHHSADGVRRSCEASLKRLNTSYLDLYLLHEYTNDFPLQDTVQTLNKLKTDGLARNIGVSNFGVAHLKEAQSYSEHPIVCNQVHYNLKVREIERAGVLNYCQENDIMVVAYRPTQKNQLFPAVPAVVEELSEKYGKTSYQIAINWLISQPNVVTICKTRNSKHLDENVGALGWQMESNDIERLRNEFPNQTDVSDTMPLG